MTPKIRIQDRVVKELYLRNSEMGVKKLCDILKLKDWQIRNAIAHLERRGLIVRRYEKNPASYSKAPYSKVYIKIKSVDRAKDVLNAKSML